MGVGVGWEQSAVAASVCWCVRELLFKGTGERYLSCSATLAGSEGGARGEHGPQCHSSSSVITTASVERNAHPVDDDKFRQFNLKCRMEKNAGLV